MVNNYDWWKEFSLLDFLRDVGKYARVGTMMAKESVKTRLNSEEGMSYTEFTYQLLQGYDFVHLFKVHPLSPSPNASVHPPSLAWHHMLDVEELVKSFFMVECSAYEGSVLDCGRIDPHPRFGSFNVFQSTHNDTISVLAVKSNVSVLALKSSLPHMLDHEPNLETVKCIEELIKSNIMVYCSAFKSRSESPAYHDAPDCRRCRKGRIEEDL